MSQVKRRSAKAWAQSIGPYGHRIRLFEDPVSGILYAEMRDPSNPCGYRSTSLRHRDRPRAVQWAHEQSAKWQAAGEQLRDPTPVLSRILAGYLKHQTPGKVASEQQADGRRARMWARFLQPAKDLSKLTLQEWQTFIEQRRSGSIDPQGSAVAPEKRKPVREGTIWGDLVFLHTVINWACKWRTDDGRYLMRENPARGYPMPREKNPRRPVATQDRFERVRAVADQGTMVVGRGETRREARSYLPELLDLVNGTGRRISAILALRCCDLRLDQGPHGAILWPADTDKTGKEWLVPIAGDVRAAINRVFGDRPVIGATYLFPSPTVVNKPVSKELASAWLVRAEALAGVPKQDGSLWHAYRRKWATERKHLPDVDVAAAGGWSDTSTLKQVYQQADQETMYLVVSEPGRQRKATIGTD